MGGHTSGAVGERASLQGIDESESGWTPAAGKN